MRASRYLAQLSGHNQIRMTCACIAVQCIRKRSTCQRRFKSGTIYQLQTSPYWVPTYDSGDFKFSPIIATTEFYHDAGWSDWSPLGVPSSVTATTNAAIANLTFATVPEPST